MTTLNDILKLRNYYYQSGKSRFYNDIKYDLIPKVERRDLVGKKFTHSSLLFDTLNQMVPFETGHQLLRFGGNKDGAYLIPNDLKGISDCFSPGVNTYKRFEDDLCERGIRCHMCDGRVTMDMVETPLLPDGLQTFQNKWLDIQNNENSITLLDWVKAEADSKTDLILQMDIEGAEYRVLLNLDEATLTRFRIIILEIHFLDWSIFDPKFLQDALAPLFYKLAKYYLPVHFHPNNVTRALRFSPEVYIPKIAEITFLRKDRVKDWPSQRCLPHALDIKNMPSKPSLELRLPWKICDERSNKDSVLRKYCATNNINFQLCHEDFLRSGCSPSNKLTIENFDGKSQKYSLSINSTGRFGNAIRQLFIAFTVAQLSSVERVYIGDFLLRNSCLIRLQGDPNKVSSILQSSNVFFSCELLGPDITNIISGPFMNPICFPLLTSLPPDFEDLLEDFVAHVLWPLVGYSKSDCNIEDTCAVHIRSGDIFTSALPNRWYGQPPLSYYKYATAQIASQFSLKEFVVVYEDLGNPVIEPYINWLDAQGYSYRTSSASFGQDFSQLVRSKYLICSKGTLAPAAALISGGKSCIVCYEAFDSKGMPFHSFSKFPIITLSHEPGLYLKPGFWMNTEEQKKLMVKFDTKYIVKRSFLN